MTDNEPNLITSSKSQRIVVDGYPFAIEIHRLENVADDIYFRAIGNLFKNSTDPIEVIKWKEFLEILENATTVCSVIGLRTSPSCVVRFVLSRKLSDTYRPSVPSVRPPRGSAGSPTSSRISS